ncbi:hypothetical protein ACFY5K_34760 [Streptomyces griseofuscus]|uniref:hypothetical protein n=1 Tax=Streptomyces TaxID=1883 RepID=UPI0018F0E1E0|nr:hypothetical protein [Streptomyces sp. CRPSP2-6A1]MBJ7004935.1 hypothetical protein [Streptomyces sp. CRPSP2-6A1]
MRRKLWTVAVLAVVLAWSTVMTALGQLAAVLALLPPLGLLVQQLAGVRAAETSAPVASTPEPGPEEEHR